MRVTSSRIIDLATQATSRAQSAVADATTLNSSGLRVQLPSDDPAAWADAQREKLRQTMASGTGSAITATLADAQQTDSALATIASVVATARQLAVQGASNVASAGDRQTLATQVTAMYQAALAAANAQGGDGHYLLGGSKSTTAPFDATGAYQGDAITRAITTGENASQTVTVAGTGLTSTSASTVDILPALTALSSALNTDNMAGIQTALGLLTTATTQLGAMRGQVGSSINALTDADTARTALQTRLSGVITDLVGVDAVAAASTLAQTTNTLSVTLAVTHKVIATLAPGG